MAKIRVYLLVVLLLLSVYLVFSPYLSKKNGVLVTSVDQNSECSNVNVGSTILQISGQPVRNSLDFTEIESSIRTGMYVPMVVDGGPGGCTAVKDGELGLGVSDFSSSGIKLGTDIGGGVTTTVKVSETKEVGDIFEVMETRLALLKAGGYALRREGDLIKIDSLEGDVSPLTKACKFEIDIAQQLNVKNGTTSFVLNRTKFNVEISNSTFSVNGDEYRMGEAFYLQGIRQKIEKVDKVPVLFSLITNGSEIIALGAPLITNIPEIESYRLQLPVAISTESSERFNKITRGIKTIYSGGVPILEATFVYVLDNQTISEIPIPKEAANQEINNVVLISFDRDSQRLERTAGEVLLCLRSGVIDADLEIVSAERFDPTDKSLAEFSITLTLLAALVTSFVFVQVRYHHANRWYALAGLLLAELVIVFGFLSLAQRYTGFLIDLPTVLGFGVFGAISVGQMILGMEYILRKENLGLSYKLKRLNRLNTIINTTVFLVGLFLMFYARGFGFVLLFGVMTGMGITKPIFYKMLSRLEM